MTRKQFEKMAKIHGEKRAKKAVIFFNSLSFKNSIKKNSIISFLEDNEYLW